jgi:sarcosine/dimethylglycine N-methyltransferase
MTTAATYTETDLVATIEHLSGTELASLTRSQLDAIDQFHAGGADAVNLILPALGLRPRMTVLDVGSGLGGPARQVARATGCAVVGVDTSASYVDTAEALTRAAGLSSQVSYVRGQVTEVEREGFDAAYTVHVQMNVADKRAFFGAIAGRLRPGARLATFEVCLSGPESPAPPLPWSLDGTDSFLATSVELRASIEDAGFEAHEWVDETAWVLQWFQEVGAASATQGISAVLPALLTDGPTRMTNFARALRAGVLSIRRGTFTRL